VRDGIITHERTGLAAAFAAAIDILHEEANAMNVSIRPEIQKFIEEQVRRGRYRSSDEVLEAALTRLMEEEEAGISDAALDAIDESEDQVERGQVQEWKNVSAELRAKYLGK
jgi:putative addiction module CopG family antidote